MGELQELEAQVAAVKAELNASKSERVSEAIAAEVDLQAPGAPVALKSLAKAQLKRDGDYDTQVSHWLKTDDAQSILGMMQAKAESATKAKQQPQSSLDKDMAQMKSKQPKKESANNTQLDRAMSEIASGKAQIRLAK